VYTSSMCVQQRACGIQGAFARVCAPLLRAHWRREACAHGVCIRARELPCVRAEHLQDTACVCGACLCCGRGLEDPAWLTGFQRASDSRMGSKESQTIIPPLRAEPCCCTAVINGLSHPALTGGDQHLTQTGREQGALGLRFWGDRQGWWQTLLPPPAHTLCLAAALPGPHNPQGDTVPGDAW